MQAFALISILAVIVEGLIEYFGAPIPSRYKMYVAALVGILLCVGYGADLLGALGYVARIPFLGEVLTGVLIGRGSNYINTLYNRARVVPMPAAPVAAVVNDAP